MFRELSLLKTKCFYIKVVHVAFVLSIGREVVSVFGLKPSFMGYKQSRDNVDKTAIINA